jgi:hypothetical protein
VVGLQARSSDFSCLCSGRALVPGYCYPLPGLPGKPLSSPISTPHPNPPSPSKIHCFVTTSLRACALPQKRDPLFSAAGALNSQFPRFLLFCWDCALFAKSTRGSTFLCNQIPLPPYNPFRIYLFRKWARRAVTVPYLVTSSPHLFPAILFRFVRRPVIC